MPRRLVILAAAILISALPQAGAFADDSVLLPSTDTPNMGLTPNTDSQSPAPATTLATPSTAPADTTSAKDTTPAPSSTQLPASASDTSSSTVAPSNTDVLSKPPQFAPVPTTMNAQDAKSYNELVNSLKTTFTINVGIANDSAFGDEDLAQINASLGITKNLVPTLCHMSVSGLMVTDAGSYAFDTGIARVAQARFNGSIQSIMAHVQAVCTGTMTPVNRNAVTQVGNQYEIGLAGVMCPPPPAGKSVRQLAVQYVGNGTGRCLFE